MLLFCRSISQILPDFITRGKDLVALWRSAHYHNVAAVMPEKSVVVDDSLSVLCGKLRDCR
jgi:hypothetical protein